MCLFGFQFYPLIFSFSAHFTTMGNKRFTLPRRITIFYLSVIIARETVKIKRFWSFFIFLWIVIFVLSLTQIYINSRKYTAKCFSQLTHFRFGYLFAPWYIFLSIASVSTIFLLFSYLQLFPKSIN